jgi:hypothetical protein
MNSARRELLCRTVYFKKTEQSDSTLRHSAVRYSIFCGSLFQLFVVSYKMSDLRSFIPETCLPAIARRAKAGHPTPETYFLPDTEFLEKYQGINLNNGIKFPFLLGFSGADAVFAFDDG